MIDAIPFTKMHGIGNDYIYVDLFAHPEVERIDNFSDLACGMAERNTGIGADGLILICPPEPHVDADVRMRMFNADGGESEMCGNGVRCVCKYAHDHGISDANPLRVQTGRGVLSLEFEIDASGHVGQVTVNMGQPILEPGRIPVGGALAELDRIADLPLEDHISLPGREQWIQQAGLDPRMTCISMGNPHLVMFCERIDCVPLETVGPQLERHALFPRRINVHFAQVESRREISMRTWERGTGITRACGTGACAVCVAGALTNRTDCDVLIHLPGGDLTLQWDSATDDVLMTGPATEVFSGVWPVHSHRRDVLLQAAPSRRT